MELHGSGELGQVLLAASREGLYSMIASHASPACQAGIAHHWESAVGSSAAMRQQAETVLASIRNGRFARHLIGEHARDYPDRRRWRAERSSRLEETEARLRAGLRGPVKSG